MGSIEMPLFFLLSGFSLAVTYGRTKWEGNTSCCCRSKEDETTLMKTFNFYRNRFARVGPIYFLANFTNFLISASTYGVYGIALHKSDIGSVLIAVLCTVSTLTGTGSWILGAPVSFSGASWTISTLMFFYLVFPNLLPRLQRYTDAKLYKLITILFFIQLSPVIPQFILRVTLGNEIAEFLYWPASGWPVSRLPVFIMGALGGLQCLRGVHNPGRWINSAIPWSCCNLQEQTEKEDMWRKRVDINSFLIILSITVFCVLNSVGYSNDNVFNFNFYSQFFCVHMQMMIIVGLTSDGGRSFLSKVCKWKPVQLLGRVSMTLYLIHMPVMDLIRVAQYGTIDCSHEEYQLWKNETFANNATLYNTTENLNLNETFEYNNLNDTDEYISLIDTDEYINLNDTVEYINLNDTVEYINLNYTDEYENITNPVCETYRQFHDQKEVFPLWAVPVLIILCPFLAWIITVCIEEPARAWLRVKPTSKTPEAAAITEHGTQIIGTGTATQDREETA